MSTFGDYLVRFVACAGLAGFACQSAGAAGFNYSETFSSFGQQANMSCNLNSGGTTFVCGAVAAINSFIYLENTYPDVYSDDPGILTPNATGNTDSTDATNFATQGFGPYTGYYERTGGAEDDYIATLTDWFNNYASGTSDLNSWYTGSSDYDYSPGINDMASEIMDGAGVEFFVQQVANNANFFHVVTLTGISCADNAETMCSITYQDPNDPGTNQSAMLTNSGGTLQFNDVTGSGYTGTVSITAMFSETPVPEPGSTALLGLGLAGLMVRGRRRGAL